MGAKPKKTVTRQKRRAPAKTVEARERQVINLAYDLAEKQLSEGTATSQVITHFLKMGTTREELEKEKLKHENELLKAKTEALESQKKREELYAKALKAMQKYSGLSEESEVIDDEN